MDIQSQDLQSSHKTAEASVNPVSVTTEQDSKIMQQILNEMKELRDDFDAKLKYDDGKQQTIDTLHKELEEHRVGLHYKILRPVFLDLIRLYDDLEKMVEGTVMQTELRTGRTLEDLQLLQSQVEEILQRYGAESFCLDGHFQSSKQKVLKTVETDNIDLDNHIAKSLSKGFFYEDKILRYEQVVVYKYTGM